GVEVGRGDTESGDGVDGGQCGLVALAPNEQQRVGELRALGVEYMTTVGGLVELTARALTLVLDAQCAVVRLTHPAPRPFDCRARRTNDGAGRLLLLLPELQLASRGRERGLVAQALGRGLFAAVGDALAVG